MVLRLLLTFLFVGFASLSAKAQTSSPLTQARPYELLDPAMAAALFAASEAVAAPSPVDLGPTATPRFYTFEERRNVSRSRWMLATWTGALVGSAVGVALGGRRTYCEYNDVHLDRTKPRIVAAAFAGVSIGMLTWGGLRLSRAPGELRKKRSTGAKVGMVAIATVSALLTTGVIGLVSFSEMGPCLYT